MDSTLGSPGLGGFGLRHRAVSSDKENNVGGGNVLHSRGAAAVKKPPRASLARLGLSSPAASRPGPSREQGANNPGGTVTAAITRRNDQQSSRSTEDDLSHWVVAYGFRNNAQHAALVRRMESCGDVTARRGGNPDNWIALRFESRLSAHKALCADGALIRAGGGQMVMGVAPLTGLATELGLDLSVGPEEAERERRKSLARRNDEISASREEDLLLLADQDRNQGKGICGRVLSWFFMWDSP